MRPILLLTNPEISALTSCPRTDTLAIHDLSESVNVFVKSSTSDVVFVKSSTSDVVFVKSSTSEVVFVKSSISDVEL